MGSNYDKQVQMARGLFMKHDQEDMIQKYSLKHDKDYLYLIFMGDRYRISRETGEVEVSNETDTFTSCSNFNIIMTFYDILCYPKGIPLLANEWCPLYSLQATMSSPDANLQNYADIFAGHPDRLWQACQKLGGARLSISAGADVYCQFDLFPFFPIQFRFWDADDEFPAKIQLLWDRNSLMFMHFETLYYVMGPLLDKLLLLFRSCPQ